MFRTSMNILDFVYNTFILNIETLSLVAILKLLFLQKFQSETEKSIYKSTNTKSGILYMPYCFWD